MPGEPQDVRVNAVNSTTLNVAWKPPMEKQRNGIIMGYHIHLQETKEEVRKCRRRQRTFRQATRPTTTTICVDERPFDQINRTHFFIFSFSAFVIIFLGSKFFE